MRRISSTWLSAAYGMFSRDMEMYLKSVGAKKISFFCASSRLILFGIYRIGGKQCTDRRLRWRWGIYATISQLDGDKYDLSYLEIFLISYPRILPREKNSVTKNGLFGGAPDRDI